ncbi:tyrosine-type recombinase/integrase, partial [Candidatus Falkowbacteria bacterium]|nr:tyrosine-type recombinase/integrase [Candidatus Falkowbacteria bacterium]
MQKFLEQTETELLIRNYSPKTRSAYLLCLKDFFSSSQFSPLPIDENRIKKFLLAKKDKGFAPQTICLYLNAIKFFYKSICHCDTDITIRFPKKNKRLPIVLSLSEILRIINAISNGKHKLLVGLAYGAGMRVSEIVRLKIKDVDLEQLTIHIKEAKGRKDRITVFPAKLKQDFMDIIAQRSRNDYVFASERGGRLTERTAQIIFARAMQKAGI